MKKILMSFALVGLFITLTSFNPPFSTTTLTDVLNGEEIVLDGNDQIIKFKRTKTLLYRLEKSGGVLDVYATPLGAAGARFGNETINTGKHSVVPQNEHFIISCVPGQEELHVQGTNLQKVRLSF